MPTKVILQHSPPLGRLAHSLPQSYEQGQGEDDSGRRQSTTAFRPSLLREINAPPNRHRSPQFIPLSTLNSSDSVDDITGSPRLLGYVFNLVACVVMLVSVAQYNANLRIATLGSKSAVLDSSGKIINLSSHQEDDTFVPNFNVAVYRWKLIGTFVVSGFGVVTNLLIILVHFDKYILTNLWTRIFHSGSQGERNILIFMLISAAVSLYINTSVLSVGENQPNVYFTTWISFATTILTFNIWRESANLRTIDDMFQSHPRKSQKQWALLTFTTLVSALTCLDSYVNRYHFVAVINNLPQSVPQVAWNRVLSLSFGSLAACVIALIGNSISQESFEMKLCGSYRLTLDWRQVEGALAAGTLGTFLYVIFVQTGASVISSQNSLGNGYFSSWFSFLISTNVFGTWIRENKHFLIVSRTRVGQRLRRRMNMSPNNNVGNT